MKSVALEKTTILQIIFVVMIIYFSYSLFLTMNHLETSKEGFIGTYFNQLYRPYYRQARLNYNSHTNYWTKTLNSALTTYQRFFFVV